MNEQFIDRVIGVLLEMRLDELQQSTYQSAGKKARAREKAHKAAATELYGISNKGDKTAGEVATDVSLIGHHAGDQADKFEARVTGGPKPTDSAVGKITRQYLRQNTNRYQGKGRGR